MITKAYSRFFQELSKNNNRDWFHANKKRYEADVKIPFLMLLDTLLEHLLDWDRRIPADSKKSLFRINRDVRFSKDKAPYHTIMKAGFSPNGKKSVLPGYYLGIDAKHIHIGGGLFNVRPPELKLVRDHIANDPEGLESIVQSDGFVQHFGRVKGEKSKRLDKSLLQAAAQTDLVFHKQFYAMAEFPLEPFYDSEQLVTEILLHFKGIRPLNEYLNKAFD